MQRILAQDLPGHLNQRVRVRGWLNNLRSLGRLNFLLLRDRTGWVQVVIEEKSELVRVRSLQPGSILQIEGRVVASEQAALKVELIEPQIEVEVPILDVPPVEYYKPQIPSDLDFILDHRALSLRNRRIAAVFKIQAEITHAYRLYMHDTVQAIEYFAPSLIGASSEGGAEFFNVDYFGYPATLAQSSQLYKQMMVGVNERVFALMPFFRAEPSQTSRHLSEGKQFEFEMGFFTHWHDLLDIQEGCIRFILSHLQQFCSKELDLLDNPLVSAPPNVPFPRLTFAEAQELYYQRTGSDEREEPDLSPAAERELCQWAFETHGIDFVFVTDWKLEKRPFYAAPKKEDPSLSSTFDLLCAGTEISSGGERRHTYASMVEGIRAKGMDPALFADYLSVFQYGMPPHGGFGIGLERLTMTLLKLKNIREASLFPSDPKRIASNRLKAHIFFGGENIRNEILHRLKQKEIVFEHFVHEATPTSEEASRVRNTPLEEGIKALILRGKQSQKNFQFNIPAHLKLDMKAASALAGEKCTFEEPAIILERYGLEIGGIPPFGNLLNIDTYFDERIAQQGKCSFNCGLLTETISLQAKDLFSLLEPHTGSFAKDPQSST